MDQFTKEIAVGKEKRCFHFTRMQNMNGVKFFITSEDDKKKPIAFSLTNHNIHGWKLTPGSARWLYAIESELADAIVETRL